MSFRLTSECEEMERTCDEIVVNRRCTRTVNEDVPRFRLAEHAPEKMPTWQALHISTNEAYDMFRLERFVKDFQDARES